MTNKKELLEILHKKIDDDQELTDEEKQHQKTESVKLTKTEIQDAIENYEDEEEEFIESEKEETSSSNEQEDNEKEIITTGNETTNLTLTAKAKKEATKEPEIKFDQVLDEEKGVYTIDPNGKDVIVQVKQTSACRIHRAAKSKGKVTIAYGPARIDIPINGGHIVFLDGNLTIDNN